MTKATFELEDSNRTGSGTDVSSSSQTLKQGSSSQRTNDPSSLDELSALPDDIEPSECNQTGRKSDDDRPPTIKDEENDSAPPKKTTSIIWSHPFQTKKEKDLSKKADDNGDGDDFVAPPMQKRKTFHMRGYDDSGETDWWFASTAVPLLAATIAPLANVLSIAALVTYWRMDLRDPDNPGQLLVDFKGKPYRDPRWCYWLNVVSLICGFIGNIFLLANFTGRIRYIVALPVTILFWYVATGILTGITIAMNEYVPPTRPFETYSQGFWYAVIAAVLYCICSFLLMFNMLGYFLGHYPQRFELNDHQRTLILQTMLFFIWLAGGGAVFSRIESDGNNEPDWSFVDGLYFCDVTILTVGFGDLVLRNDLGRALIFPYTVGGIIMLGLVISSISKFAADMSSDHVVRKHFEHVRSRTLEYSTMDKDEWEQREKLRHELSHQLSHQISHTMHLSISAPRNLHHLHHVVSRQQREKTDPPRSNSTGSGRRASLIAPIRKRTNIREAVKLRHKKVKLLREERDRFDEMRRLQHQTKRFKDYWALTLSVLAFALLWCIGAVVFWVSERDVQGMSYFQSLYFCYVSLLTIGYGDFAPQSNAGRSFFVVWSLIAVPTITLLINDMGSTVIESFKRGTFVAADFTILLRKGIWNDFLRSHPKINAWVRHRKEKKARKQRMEEGLPVGDEGLSANNEDDPDGQNSDEKTKAENGIERLARETTDDQIVPPTEAQLANQLSEAIRRVALDISNVDKHYSFEEWAELTRLIRFTGSRTAEAQKEEEDDVIDWDWLGEDSPMMSNVSEPEFVMQKLCQSLARNMKRMDRQVHYGKREIERLRQHDLIEHHGGIRKSETMKL